MSGEIDSEGRAGVQQPPPALVAFDRARGDLVAGADEAGRGCLAGPIVAAGVCIDYAALASSNAALPAGLDDSKKLTPTRREDLYGNIVQVARAVAVVVRSAAYIDQFGLHKTNLHCLGTALVRVAPADTHDCALLSDGYMPFGLDRPCEQVVKGDARSAAIAAASVVAKVTRDRLMRRAALSHPGWGFEKHVGYATPAHREAIGRLGLSPLHRRSFASSAYEQLSLVA